MGRLTNLRSPLAPPPARVSLPPKVADSFYLSPEWRSLMRELIAERGAWCEDCGAGGRGVRLFGDHVVEIGDGGARLDKANVRLRCGRCHARKTAAVRAQRARGQT